MLFALPVGLLLVFFNYTSALPELYYNGCISLQVLTLVFDITFLYIVVFLVEKREYFLKNKH